MVPMLAQRELQPCDNTNERHQCHQRDYPLFLVHRFFAFGLSVDVIRSEIQSQRIRNGQ